MTVAIVVRINPGRAPRWSARVGNRVPSPTNRSHTAQLNRYAT